MFPASLKEGNFIKIPSGYIRENNWPGVKDYTTFEKLIESNMTVRIQILNPQKQIIDTWEVQAFGFQENCNICINTNVDALSGFFSGCWMAVYTKNGLRRVAHVYTKEGGGEAKNAYIAEIEKKIPGEKHFIPQLKAPAHQCLGIITRENEFYSLGVKQIAVQFEFEVMYVDKAS